ncbi:MAG: hypothetical protein IKL10_04870 [Clostridia bacterium]|nr:hypothetical protein [Clostridia bacterium]
MTYIIEILATYWIVSVVLEIGFLAFVIWCFFNEKKLKRFEDKLIKLLIKRAKKLHEATKSELLDVARKVFLFFYVPIRKAKMKLCRRWLSQLDMKAVRK